MKHIKQICALFFASAFIVLNIFSASAYEKDEHNKMMCDVLFKNFKTIENDKDVADEIKALEYASYLAIDQFNGNGQSELDYLKNYGVKEIPKLSEIDYSGGSYHRRATHRGWDGEINIYEGATLDRWIIRKKILINTADKIFDFKGNKEKRESFCAIIYYIHILGDRLSDKKYYVNTEIMELGGRTDELDITNELIKHFEILFKDIKNTHRHKYQHVISKLELYNSKISELMKEYEKDGKMSDENFKLYQKYAEDINEVLRDNLPEMLKNEDFFSEVFYK